MADVIFFEKPGCINNTKQKQWLVSAGHTVQAVNILEHPWTADELRKYFGDKPVKDWFNYTAPAVKSGEVVPDKMDAEAALNAMVAQPILIKRPLIQVGAERVSGFDSEFVNSWIGLSPVAGNEEIVAALEKDNLTLCPMLEKNTSCDELQKAGQPAVPLRPLGLVLTLVEELGFEITYEYDDLVFVSHNAFIFRFTDRGHELELWFNRDCEAKEADKLTKKIIQAGGRRQLEITRKGLYSLEQTEGENLKLEFIEAS